MASFGFITSTKSLGNQPSLPSRVRPLHHSPSAPVVGSRVLKNSNNLALGESKLHGVLGHKGVGSSSEREFRGIYWRQLLLRGRQTGDQMSNKLVHEVRQAKYSEEENEKWLFAWLRGR